MKYFFIIIALFVAGALTAQEEILILEKECATMPPKRILQGETIIRSSCDTLYLLSATTIKYLENAVKEGQTISEMSKDLQDSLVQDLRFAVDSYYEVYNAYHQLSEESTQFLAETSRSMNGINTALENANEFAEIANKNIAAANELIRKEQKNRFWKDLGKIGGGLVFGSVIGILIAN